MTSPTGLWKWVVSAVAILAVPVSPAKLRANQKWAKRWSVGGAEVTYLNKPSKLSLLTQRSTFHLTLLAWAWLRDHLCLFKFLVWAWPRVYLPYVARIPYFTLATWYLATIGTQGVYVCVFSFLFILLSCRVFPPVSYALSKRPPPNYA